MDVQRCVTLHNEILLHGWTHSGNSADDFESNCKTWYESDSAAAEGIRNDLTPDLFDFLRQARQPPKDRYFHFFYFVHSLYQGDGLYMDYERWEYEIDEGDEKRYVTLYGATSIGSHPQGLAFDQETNLAILLPSLWDMDDNFTNQYKRRPLESILESWLTMIRKGKIVAMSKKDREALSQHRVAQDPWVEVPYSETVLDETIDTFNRLESITGPFNDQYLTAMQLSPGFSYAFMLRARRPNFQFIAPGLSIPDSPSFTAQPFWSSFTDPAFRDHSYHTNPPILLFTSSHLYSSPTIRTNPHTNTWSSFLQTSWYIYTQVANRSGFIHGIPIALRNISAHYNRDAEKARVDPNHPFSYPFNKIHSYSAGLYIAPGDTEDEIKLLLPEHAEGGRVWD
ncbi:hypothetical protein E8E12_003006 [Didymella heteroderae]|uniref:Uncharacterized protein n=1 Tax=Didymella heteroderae TaxID=1769908 RepID=A0A9P5C165_9PLEO|nr:hypothetical protein E8E12_003006 [Didymella heteroderae]